MSTFETLTLHFNWDNTIPLVRVFSELEQLSISNESVLQRIRIDLECPYFLTGNELLRRLDGIDNIRWEGLSRLWLLEVGINMTWGMLGVPDEPQVLSYIGDLERGICDKFKRIKNRGVVEVRVTLYINDERPGGEYVDPAVSWERFIT